MTTQILTSARQRPPPSPPLSGSVIGWVENRHHWGLCSETLSGSSPASPRFPEHAFILLLLLISVRTQLEEGDRRGSSSAAPLLPLPIPLPQALCEILLWPSPEWGWPSAGGMRSCLCPPMKDSLCKIKCSFQSEGLL